MGIWSGSTGWKMWWAKAKASRWLGFGGLLLLYIIILCSTGILQRREAFEEVCMMYSGLMLNWQQLVEIGGRSYYVCSRIIVYEVSLKFSSFLWNFSSPMHQMSESSHKYWLWRTRWRQKDHTLRRCFHLEGCSFTHCAGQALWNTSFTCAPSRRTD